MMKNLQGVQKTIFEKLDLLPEHINFHESFNKLREQYMNNQTVDWRFNSFHWVLDTHKVVMSIIYSFVKMQSRAIIYKKFRERGDSPTSSHPQINFYCDSTTVNLYTCRDKTALMVWSYLHPFNPRNKKEVLSYRAIVERLKAPKNFGFNFSGQENFLKALNLLGNKNNEFKRLEEYRHYKIHRWEPRVEIFGQLDFQGFPYVTFNYENNELEPELLRDKIDKVIWDYDELEKNIDICINKMLISLTQCYQIFSRSSPYNLNLS